MEAALYVPSGSMGNRCDLEAHTHPGEKVLYEASNHLFLVERLPTPMPPVSCPILSKASSGS